MPWNRTDHIIPPLDKEIWCWKDGKKEKKKLEILDIYDGRGGVDKKCPDYWSYVDLDYDPDKTGKDITKEPVGSQDAKVDPKREPVVDIK